MQKKFTTGPFNVSVFAKNKRVALKVINKYKSDGGYLLGLKKEITSFDFFKVYMNNCRHIWSRWL